jgi:hypothetical protein
MSHFLSKFHLQERPKSDQKHDQNTTKHDPTRHRIFEIFERATRHDYRNGWSVPTLAKNHKKFQKKTKKLQKSDNLSLFKISPVAFVAPQKKRQKGDKRRHFVAFHFVAAHPSLKPLS